MLRLIGSIIGALLDHCHGQRGPKPLADFQV
jgi:hypothetical protein